MTSYINKFKEEEIKITTTTMYLMVKDEQLFKNYNKIWKKKNESLIRKRFNNKSFYGNDDNRKYIKTKL